MMIRHICYLRVVVAFNKTNGAFNSSSFIAEEFKRNGIAAREIRIVSIYVWLRLLFCGTIWQDDNISIIGVNYKRGVYHNILRIFNYLLFSIWLNRFKSVHTLIIDGLLPVSRLPSVPRIVSFIRSSPICLAFQKSDNRREHLIDVQFNKSNAIVCASADALDAWRSFGLFNGAKIFKLMVPLKEVLSGTPTSEMGIDHFLKNDEKLNIVVFSGNFGPRKGLLPLMDCLASLDRKKFRLCIFGAIDERTADLTRSFSYEIETFGFRNVNFLIPSTKNVLRIYPSFSECVSPAQLQGLFSGDSTLLNRRGLDSKQLDWIGRNIVFDNFEQVSQIIIQHQYKFTSIAPNKVFLRDYREIFNFEFKRILQYVKDT